MGWDPFGSKAKKQAKRAAQEAQAAAQKHASLVQEQAKHAAEAARKQAAAEAEALRFNAAIFARNADIVEEQALIDEARLRRAGNRFVGEQQAAIAGSGFANVGFGDIREMTDADLDLDAIIVRRQGQTRAADYLAEEQLALMTADNVIEAGEMMARNTILEGGIRAHGIISEGNYRASSLRMSGQAAQSSSISSTLGLGLSAAGIFFSDARIKENVERVGEAPNGIGIFTFNYVWDDPAVRRVGVMAQEVRERFPEAVSRGEEGILMVDYSKIGLPIGHTFTDALRTAPKRSRMGREGVFGSSHNSIPA